MANIRQGLRGEAPKAKFDKAKTILKEAELNKSDKNMKKIYGKNRFL